MGQRRSITGSRILITGASQGIGKALAETAAARGAKVLVCARKIELLEEVAQQIRAKGGTIVVAQADVTIPEDRKRLVEAAEKAFGGLDILINNAGIGATGHFADAGPERLRQIMEVNFFGTTETTRAFLPMLKKGNKPAIVNISSIAAKRGIPARSDYSASKFAVQGFSEAIRAELAKDGVDVIVVCPGLTQTNFSHNMIEQKALVQLDHMRGMTPEEVAAHTMRAIEKGYNESCLTLNGKLIALVSRFFPWIADIVVKRKVRGLFKDEIAARKSPGMSAAIPGGQADGRPA
ncbi:MAG TPA: SDR family oxidoreductase [Gemmataceae bacterium]|nr:SDR family oxidoreductase [Gemmataceae bacterium]